MRQTSQVLVIETRGRALYAFTDRVSGWVHQSGIRAALTQTQLSVPVSGGEMALGTWQGIFLYEHRSERHRREVVLRLIGE